MNMPAGPASWVTAVAALAVLALVGGGVKVLRDGDRLRGVLMLVCAAVILGNVLIWTV